MSLSVEELWETYYALEEWADMLLRADETVIGEDGVETALAHRNILIDAISGLRELITIKEASQRAISALVFENGAWRHRRRDSLEESDEDLQALMDRDMED